MAQPTFPCSLRGSNWAANDRKTTSWNGCKSAILDRAAGRTAGANDVSVVECPDRTAPTAGEPPPGMRFTMEKTARSNPLSRYAKSCPDTPPRGPRGALSRRRARPRPARPGGPGRLPPDPEPDRAGHGGQAVRAGGVAQTGDGIVGRAARLLPRLERPVPLPRLEGGDSPADAVLRRRYSIYRRYRLRDGRLLWRDRTRPQTQRAFQRVRTLDRWLRSWADS